MADGEGIEVEEIAKLPSNTARINSCKITVVNNLDVPLVLEDMAHVTGGFTTLPASRATRSHHIRRANSGPRTARSARPRDAKDR